MYPSPGLSPGLKSFEPSIEISWATGSCSCRRRGEGENSAAGVVWKGRRSRRAGFEKPDQI
jgi:hypothetical protein